MQRGFCHGLLERAVGWRKLAVAWQAVLCADERGSRFHSAVRPPTARTDADAATARERGRSLKHVTFYHSVVCPRCHAAGFWVKRWRKTTGAVVAAARRVGSGRGPRSARSGLCSADDFAAGRKGSSMYRLHRHQVGKARASVRATPGLLRWWRASGCSAGRTFTRWPGLRGARHDPTRLRQWLSRKHKVRSGKEVSDSGLLSTRKRIQEFLESL